MAVSCDASQYDVQLVRLLHGDERAEGIGFREIEIPSTIDGPRPGRLQTTHIGSYAQIPDAEGLRGLTSFTISLFMSPTLLERPGGQMIFARRSADGALGGAFGLDGEGRLTAWSGTKIVLQGDCLPLDAWSWIIFSYDAETSMLRAFQTPLLPVPGSPSFKLTEAQAQFTAGPDGCPTLIGAALQGSGTAAHFNGRIEDVTVQQGSVEAALLGMLDPGQRPSLPIAARWDFGCDVDSVRLVDVGPNAIHGCLHQSPARAVPGHNWTGREVDFRRVPDEYRAVHFHEDDLDDCGWDYDLDFQLPHDLASGVYAFRLRANGAEDHVPFFVSPPVGKARARIALVMPTFSYLAYANERISDGVDFAAAGMTDRQPEFGPYDALLAAHREFGLSMYDHHQDGSGVIYASWRRPILNLRPRYRWWLSDAPQYLACDLYIVNWLESLGEPYDIITDHDIHAEGQALLDRYRVVITSSHPEYMSFDMMSAFDRYAQDGGRLIYLGGNGFYWVTSIAADRPHIIEVRRGMAGTRAWESAAGEEHHSTTGERGGLWRHRGLSPNRLTGVGFAAQGWSRQSPGYRIAEKARIDPATSWIFDGITDAVIGDFGYIMGGAAGDELDRADVKLGTPRHTTVLASSEGHGRYYLQVHEDSLFSHAALSGELNPNVRADLTFFETAKGGAVFSVGSKAWVGSLPWLNYNNNVAQISANILNGFLHRSFGEAAP